MLSNRLVTHAWQVVPLLHEPASFRQNQTVRCTWVANRIDYRTNYTVEKANLCFCALIQSLLCPAGVGGQWDFSGSTLVTSSYIRLTPDERSKQGSIWNTVVSKHSLTPESLLFQLHFNCELMTKSIRTPFTQFGILTTLIFIFLVC